MALHKLFLFAKNTDAPATEQGFQYQKLKTLKIWLENRINKVDEDILCDYEEDIFQRNLKEGKLKFRQIKLYSTNFSFSRDEIKKSIAHFFMLFVKGEYKFDEIEFSFETNSTVAKDVRGNEADLLREWASSQTSMTDELKSKCRDQVKAILDEYIEEAFQARREDENTAEIQAAKNIYDGLTDETWDAFVGSIKWQFDDIPPERAIPLLLEEIELLIPDLPLPLDTAKASTYISVLHFEIANRTAKTEEADKTLTNQLLDVLLLNVGSEQEQWYASVYQKWADVKEVVHFKVGAFYEVINAARHCRWEMHDSDHEAIWLSLLKKYIELGETIVMCRKKAIYEYLFLMISPHPETFQPKGKLSGEPELIRYYFNELAQRDSFANVEEDIVLLQLVQAQQLLDGPFLDKKEIQEWTNGVEHIINEKIAYPANPDELCLAYELKGTFIFHLNALKPLNEKINEALETYRKILEPLKSATSYSISRLSDQLNQILNVFIRFKDDDEVTSAIEDFIDEIEEQSGKTGKQHNLAHGLVERGIAYLNTTSPKNCLKALDCFHKAKELWFLQETKEGHILALINIAQVYSALGMHLAAKYYGLCGVWASFHFGDYSTLKRTSDSYAMVFHADYAQGAWMSALEDFSQYIKLKIEFAPEDLVVNANTLLGKTLVDLACILSASTLLHSELGVFIEYQKTNLGWLYTDYLQGMVEAFNEQFADEKTLHRVLTNKLNAPPLNDVGATRTIAFNSLGIEWRIFFQNTSALTAIAEEFGALLQITLCEIGLQPIDIHLLELPVTINLSVADNYTQFIKQHPSHENTGWDIGIPILNAAEKEKIQPHYGFLAANVKMIINDLSLLPKAEFEKVFDSLYQKQELGKKGLATQTYQRVYFNLTNEEAFDKMMRSAFQPLPGKEYSVKSSDLLKPKEGDSTKYNQVQSIEHINNRYTGTLKRLNVSLSIWEKQPEFKALICELRKQGWLDWQIIVALMNFVLSTKANKHIESLHLADERERQKAFEEEMKRIVNLSEAECYEKIPVEWLQTPGFKLYMSKLPVDLLPSYGLENQMGYPNFEAIRVFLNRRFHFDTDNKAENNPLADS